MPYQEPYPAPPPPYGYPGQPEGPTGPAGGAALTPLGWEDMCNQEKFDYLLERISSLQNQQLVKSETMWKFEDTLRRHRHGVDGSVQLPY